MSTSEPREGIVEIARSDIAGLRQAMTMLGLIVAEIDCDLRYVWIDNPHPDFDPTTVVGKRDEDLLAPGEAAEITALKRAVLKHHAPVSKTLGFRRSDGMRYYSLRAYPIRGEHGRVDGIISIGFEAPL
jgi:hypothetical protein